MEEQSQFCLLTSIGSNQVGAHSAVMNIEFGARLVKTATAVVLAVLLSNTFIGDAGIAIFAGLSAFAAVTPNLQQSWNKALHTLSANLLGCLWAALVVSAIPSEAYWFYVEVTLAIFLGLFLSHHVLPGQEQSALTAILAMMVQAPEVGQLTAVFHRLGVVLFGALTGLAVNALYPPRHLQAAEQLAAEAMVSMSAFADRIIESVEHPENLEKTAIKQDREEIESVLNEAVRRLSYVDRQHPERQELRWRVHTLHILLDSLVELHRWALHHQGFGADDRRRLDEAVHAVLRSLAATQERQIPSSVWNTLEEAALHCKDELSFYPLHHVISRVYIKHTHVEH